MSGDSIWSLVSEDTLSKIISKISKLKETKNLDSFIQDLNLKSKFFDNNKKIIIYYKKNRIVLSGGSSFFLINTLPVGP